MSPADAALRQLASQQPAQRVAAGSRLFDAGAPCPGFPFIDAGCVRVALASSDGRHLELYRVEPGEICIVSAICLFAGRPALAQGEALGETLLRLIPPAAFEQACQQDPQLQRWVMGLMAERLADLMTLVEAVAFQRLDQRLAALLLARGPVLRNTHQQLADELGTVREIVSRLLRRFERDGWIAQGRERIELLRSDALRRLS